MYLYIRLILCFAAIITHDAAYSTKLSYKEYQRFSIVVSEIDSNELLYVRGEEGNPYINITLETDADAAKQFVEQIKAGQVPSIITNLPQEAVIEFSDILNMLASIPTEIINVAEAAVTEVVSIVDDLEDGSITSVLAALPSHIVADVTKEWSDLTNGLTDAWNGLTSGINCDLLHKCPTTPVETCGTPPIAAATTSVNAPSTPTNNAAYITSTAFAASASSVSQISTFDASTATQQLSTESLVQSSTPGFTQSTPQGPTQPSLARRNFERALENMLGIAVVGILGVAVWL